MTNSNRPINALTVDVEDYFHVEAFADVVQRDDWHNWESRVERNTNRLLELLASHKVHSTFFILGWVAKQAPQLARRIAEAGHEIACHSYHHQLIHTQTREEFRADLRRAKFLLEDLTGQEVIGYRAPTYSITKQTLWALDVLIEEGFRYDSSIFPILHDRYGIPGAERFIHLIRRQAGDILEFPPSSVRVAGVNIPMTGGGYFRFLPYPLFRWGLRHINQNENQPAIFMVHAWEVDPDQPLIAGTRLNIWRHRNNLKQTESRLHRLLNDFRFAPMRDLLRLNQEQMEIPELPKLPELNAVGSNPAFARMD
ncbi:MAG: XrtA system polysaccharide deacetylase [Blastocatellia bacterium]